MSRIVAQYDPTVTPNGGTFNASFANGVGKLVIYNESNVNQMISWPGNSDYLAAWTAHLYCIQTSQVNLNWSPISTLKIINPPISQVLVVAFTASEQVMGTFPAPIVRQTAPALVGNPQAVFSATVGFGATSTKYQALNIFNPLNSGVNYTFHSARVFTNDTTLPACNLILIQGADKNFSTPITPVSHNGIGTPPVSTSNCTAQDFVAAYAGNYIEVLDANANITQDFLIFPDSVLIAPGNNLMMQLTAGASGHIVRLTMKWTEG